MYGVASHSSLKPLTGWVVLVDFLRFWVVLINIFRFWVVLIDIFRFCGFPAAACQIPNQTNPIYLKHAEFLESHQMCENCNNANDIHKYIFKSALLIFEKAIRGKNFENGFYPRQELRENPLGTHSSVARVLVAVYEVVVEVVVTWIFGLLKNLC